MDTLIKVLKIIVSVGIGLFFIVSAVLKLLSLDNFELYIYSFNIVGFSWSGLVARGIIACEILIGILLIIRVKYKWAWWFAMLMLVGFSFLLVYVMLFRNDSNCHCMGDLVELKPSLSLVKNIVTIGLLLLVRKEEDFRFKGRILALVLAVVFAVVPPFVLFPMDDVYNLISKSDDMNYSETDFNALMADSTMQDVHIDDGNYLVGFVASGCPYCRTSGLKLSEMVDNNHLDTNRILFFVWGDSASVAAFKTETKTEVYRYVPIDPLVSVRVTLGSFPQYLFIKNGEVVKTADLRHLTEKSVCDHLR